jgi:hypothetical protein
MKTKLALSALLFTVAVATHAQSSQWVAINDYRGGANTHVNATAYDGLQTTNSGPLKNIATGATLPVSLTVTNKGCANGTTSGTPATGTPAYTNFNGFVTFANSIVQVQQPLSTSNVLAYVFTGLDPARRYSFRGTAVRGNAAYNYRWTLTRLEGAASFTDAHSSNVLTSTTAPGTGILATNEVAFNGGIQNTAATGDIVDWENIAPASSTIVIYNYMYTNLIPASWGVPGNYATNNQHSYGFEAIRLEEFSTGVDTCVGITNQSGNISVPERGSANFSISATGTPQTIRWYRSNDGGANYSLIAGAVSTTYTISSVAASDNNARFYANVSNATCNVNSSVKILTVIPDGTPPTALNAVANTNLTTITISFSEALASSSVTPSAFAVYLTGSSPGGPVDTASVTNGTNVIITVTSSPMTYGQNYSVRITGVTDTAGTPNPISPNPTVLPIHPNVIVFPLTKTWRFNQTGQDLGTAWKEVGYDDTVAGWSSGPGVLGFETTAATIQFLTNVAPPFGTNTVLNLVPGGGAGTNGTNITIYFRTSVNISNFNPASATMTMRAYIDDGAVIYVNGTERLRVNYNNPIGYLNFAAGASPEAALVVSNITGFVQGDNLIAVEVHQDAVNSSDLDFGMQLEANISSFVPSGPQLTTSRNGNQLTITWSGGGTLQRSIDLNSTNNWQTINGASSPFVTNTSGGLKFFRVTVP